MRYSARKWPVLAKLLIKQGKARTRIGIPGEAQRIEIIRGLLNLKHFQGIWYSGQVLSVRRFADGAPEYLSWTDAAEMIAVAAAVQAERKPAAKATGKLIVGFSASNADGK
jgi:hypothetical protein